VPALAAPRRAGPAGVGAKAAGARPVPAGRRGLAAGTGVALSLAMEIQPAARPAQAPPPTAIGILPDAASGFAALLDRAMGAAAGLPTAAEDEAGPVPPEEGRNRLLSPRCCQPAGKLLRRRLSTHPRSSRRRLTRQPVPRQPALRLFSRPLARASLRPALRPCHPTRPLAPRRLPQCRPPRSSRQRVRPRQGLPRRSSPKPLGQRPPSRQCWLSPRHPARPRPRPRRRTH